MKIAVYTIALNELQHVERFCASAADADVILVADTGSTDGTIDALWANGAQVEPIVIAPWRFDHARNAALDLLPGDIDVCISLDLDEVLEPGWREEIERIWTFGMTRMRYVFDWSAGVIFKSDKIHQRHGYRWKHPVHETLHPELGLQEAWGDTGRLLIRHLPDMTKSRSQYMPLLRLSVEEDPNDPHNAFYYARELHFAGEYRAAIDEALRYLRLPAATWDHERCYAMRIISLCHTAIGDDPAALTWARMATSAAPETREPWCNLALIAYGQKDWPICYDAATKAISIRRRELAYTSDPAAWGSLPHDLASIAAWWLDLKDAALFHATNALIEEPDNERIKANIAMMRGQQAA